MNDNYIDYLKNVPAYSPRVTNLTKEEGFRTVTLRWTNPPGDLAVKIKITTGDEELVFDEMIDHYTFEDLDVKGYEMAVYTIDRYGNISVPATISVFPGIIPE
jgi:hypothetical protein